MTSRPTPASRICLNMIVRNEAAIIERCLTSLLPAIDTWAILDTGSSDDTPERVERFFAARGLPGTLGRSQFVDFATSRNEALDLCRGLDQPFDYILLADADMELEIISPGFRDLLSADAYLVRQTSGITYSNIRLIRREADARYVGATHEYLDVAGRRESLDALHFIDHACGSSRSDKLARDERLLTAELAADPTNARAMFYLAQTLREAGRTREAIAQYERRIAAGGWDEERWYAQYQRAHLLRDVEGDVAFERALREAHAARPHRGEPLRDLSRFFRGRGEYERALECAEGLATLGFPASDLLFVDHETHASGADEELSIAGYYSADPARREAGRAACARLSMRRDVSERVRERARSNARFYAQRLEELFPAAQIHPIDFTPPEGWHALNPSLANDGANEGANGLRGIVRTVDYAILPDGRYALPHDGRIRTRNFLIECDTQGRTGSAKELVDRTGAPAVVAPISGYEDCRFFRWKGREWCTATVRDRSETLAAEIALLELRDDAIVSAEVLRGYGDRFHQKNWLPFVDDEERLLLLYSADPTIVLEYREDEGVREYRTSFSPYDLSHLRGGTPLIRLDDGWIYVAHSVVHEPRRVYLHHLVELDRALTVIAVTEPFVFTRRSIEFAAGIAVSEDALAISFGADDREAFVATVPLQALRRPDAWVRHAGLDRRT